MYSETDFLAILNGGEEGVRTFMTQGRVNEKDYNGLGILHWAAYKGFTDIVRQLINEHGMDKNLKAYGSVTPLHLAAAEGLLEVVELLAIELKADVNAVSVISGDTPLHRAARNGHKETVRVLASNKANVLPRRAMGVYQSILRR